MDREEAGQHLDTIRQERIDFANMNALPEVSEDAPAAIGVVGGEEVKAADTALNGAQVSAATQIVAQVAAGGLPRDAGVSMLVEFFNIPKPSAERVMGTVGRSFKPAVPDEQRR